MSSDTIRGMVERDGFAIVDSVLSDVQADALLAALERSDSGESLRMRGGVFAIRNLLESIPEVAELAASPTVRSLAEAVLGPHCFPVRGILFDKVPEANWKVPWHQDVTIAIQERIETAGFGPWSMKAGVLHVQPPASVLEQMISIRLHLDSCTEDNGALRVIPGSQREGKIPEAQVTARVSVGREVVCPVARGGALLMRPLLLHASSPSKSPAHRRVIHIDYAAVDLPNGLLWFTADDSMSNADLRAALTVGEKSGIARGDVMSEVRARIQKRAAHAHSRDTVSPCARNRLSQSLT